MIPNESTGINTPADGLWVTVSELARMKGVDKGGVSRRAKRFEVLGAIETRQGPGGTKLVNVAAYDRAAGEIGDAIRALNNAPPELPQPPLQLQNNDPTLAREQMRRVGYQADLAELELKHRLKQALPVEDVKKAIIALAEVTVRIMERFPTYADEVATAVGKDGSHGARTILKQAVTATRKQLALEVERMIDELLCNGPEKLHSAPE